MLGLGAGLLASAARGAAASTPAPSPAITLHVSQRLILITPRYQGQLVHVEGTAPPPYDVVLKLTSPRGQVVCSKKGKEGPFWLSLGQVRFEQVPRMFKIKSTAPVEAILSPAEQVKWRLGEEGLKASMRVQGGADRSLYLDELLLIRKRGRLFDFQEGQVDRVGNTFSTSFFWPPSGPPGRYLVVAYAVEGGRVIGTAEAWVEVQTVGLEAWVRELARNHGVLYGLFAVALATASGLAVSLLFGAFKRWLG